MYSRSNCKFRAPTYAEWYEIIFGSNYKNSERTDIIPKDK